MLNVLVTNGLKMYHSGTTAWYKTDIQVARGVYIAPMCDPPQNCHLNIKKMPKI